MWHQKDSILQSIIGYSSEYFMDNRSSTSFTSTSRVLATGSGIFNGQDPLEDEINIFLVQAVIIIGVCRVLGILGSYLKQPKVIFEIVGGILLGPTAISKNDYFHYQVMKPATLSYLKLVAEFGLLLYLFVVGMELDVVKLKTHAKRAGLVAISGMAIPFVFGIAICRPLFDTLEGNDPAYKDVSFVSFFVFIGTAMSITAFPVLARILKESGMIYSRAGALVMGAAALNDAVAWCLLILAISIANAGDMNTAGYVFAVVLGIAISLLVFVRPALEKFVLYLESFKSKVIRSNLFAFSLLITFICAWTTALLGLDVIFGAFIFGLTIPRDTQLFKDCNEFIEEFVLTITLPIYFALSGLKTDITQISTGTEGAMIVLVCVVASLGKFIGAGGAALIMGVSKRESAAIAVLMNTRGLVELIVLNLGLQSGILNTKTFSVMVIMCLFTTFLTCPLIEYIYPPHLRINDVEDVKEDKQSEGISDIEADVAITIQTDVLTVSRESRLAVIIDRLEHLQGVMDLLACLQPNEDLSDLSLTVMKFEEPSFTDRDEFIALMRDRLISVHQESTDIHALIHPDISKPIPQLLPLSMFAKAIGASVNAYDIRGDPQEFPSEVRSLMSEAESSMIIFPWRASQYLERFVWGTLRQLSCPLALFLQVDISVPIIPEGRQRGNSILGSISSVTGDTESHRYASTTGIELPVFQPQQAASESHARPKLKRVLVLITGSFADIAIYCFVLRLLQQKSLHITIMVCEGHSFPDPVKVAFMAFRKASVDYRDRLQIVKLEEIEVSDVDDIQHEIAKQSYDLFIHSYISPDIVVPSVPMDASGTNPVTKARSNTISAIASTFLSVEPKTVEFRKTIGVPEAAIYSGLTHPELGALGDRIFRARTIPYLLIFHEPLHTATKRRNTMSFKPNPDDPEMSDIPQSPSYTLLFGRDDENMTGPVHNVPFTPKKMHSQNKDEFLDKDVESSELANIPSKITETKSNVESSEMVN